MLGTPEGIAKAEALYEKSFGIASSEELPASTTADATETKRKVVS